MPIRKVFPMRGYLEDNQPLSEYFLPSDVFSIHFWHFLHIQFLDMILVILLMTNVHELMSANQNNHRRTDVIVLVIISHPDFSELDLAYSDIRPQHMIMAV